MDLIGKTTINPVLFYSGKFSGYFTWVTLFLSLLGIDIFEKISVGFNGYISCIFLLTGLVFVTFSLINLGSSTRLGLPSENTVFKTNGLYKISRNPMYIGFNLLTIASLIYTLNILVIALGIYSIIIYHLIILGEERFLGNRFGQEYTNFKKKVRRYL